jgi:copper resistance protein C
MTDSLSLPSPLRLPLRSPRRWLAACCLSLGVSFVFAASAWAHAKPVSREPAPDAEVSAPSAVTIHFSEPLEPAFSKIGVVGADGKAAASAQSEVDANDKTTMHLALPSLAPGRYTVQWTAVAEDGHRTNGSYGFNIK